MCVRKYCVSDLSSCTGSELGIKLTSLAGSELGSQLTSLAGSELGLASYRLIEDYFPATYEQELCPFNFLLASCHVSSSELSPASYSIKMLITGSELTKEDRESQLYDEFKHFKMLSGENINEYYVWFHKLVNDMMNIRMTMPNIQLNSKFVNNISPEWDRMFKGDRIILRGNLLEEMVQFAMKEHILELGMSMQVKGNQSSVLTVLLMQAQENGAVLDEEELLFLTGEQTNSFDADVDDHPVRDLALNDDNIFQVDECDAFDLNVDDEPTAQSIFMANLSLAGPTNQQAGPSNASILSEVHDLENAIDPCYDYQDEHVIHNAVQQKNIIDSTRDHMGNSNVIPYEQYLSVNDVSVVPSCASSVSNDAYVLHDNDTYIPHDPLVTELNIYKEQVDIYKQHARCPEPFLSQKGPKGSTALYDGTELLKANHVSVLVTSSEEDLELAKTTRIKMNGKMNDHTQITPEQVFWSKEINAKKADDLKARTLPLPVLPKANVYPPNTPVHLVPHTLPITSQVNIGMAMKTTFENLEAEVDQNAIDLKSGEIERKNLLIANDNLIADCLSKDVFYTATDSVLTVSRFSDVHEALNAAQKRIAELESENSNMQNKIQNDDHDVMVNHFYKLDVEHLNMQLKYQHLKESFENRKSVTSSDAPTYDSVFVIGQLKDQTQLTEHHKSNCVTMPALKSKVLAPGRYAIDIEPIPPRIRNSREVYLDYLKHLKESVKTLREIVEEAKVETPLDISLASAFVYTIHSHELLEYVIGTCLKDFNQHKKKQAATPVTRKKQVTFVDPCETSTNNTLTHVKQHTMHQTNKHAIPSTGVNGATAASGSNHRSNTKKDMTLPAKSDTQKVEFHPRNNKSSVK
nr:hypothetical protein [Tanacetum cinerariifolium]